MEKLIISELNQISKTDKKKLEKLGFVLIEAKDPDKVKVVTPVDLNFVSSSDLFMSALKGANSDMTSKARFADELYLRMKLSETKKAEVEIAEETDSEK